MNPELWRIYVASALAFILLSLTWLQLQLRPVLGHEGPSNSSFTYIDEDYPTHWPLPSASALAMHPEDTHRYSLDTTIGAAQWRALIPSAAPNGTIHLGPNARPFTVAMFHQLQCLDIIRVALISDGNNADDPQATVLVNHCMNYLRQVVLCHGHLALESVRSDKRPKITDLTRSTYECRDWRILYDEVLE